MNFETMAARALNNAWVTHKPSYAGVRLLLNSISDEGSTLSEHVTRRAKTRQDWRYFGHEITKEVLLDGTYSYRNCIVGSPTTILAEAYILSEMSREDAFRVPSCAFSYRWPRKENAGRNFEYFFDGYQERNATAARLLQQNGAVATVIDIKRFYPSVDVPGLRNTLSARLDAVVDSRARERIASFCFGMLSTKSPKTSQGLPIGPDLSPCARASRVSGRRRRDEPEVWRKIS